MRLALYERWESAFEIVLVAALDSNHLILPIHRVCALALGPFGFARFHCHHFSREWILELALHGLGQGETPARKAGNQLLRIANEERRVDRHRRFLMRWACAHPGLPTVALRGSGMTSSLCPCPSRHHSLCPCPSRHPSLCPYPSRRPCP